MSHTDAQGRTLPVNFLLTPEQSNLLYAALNSNKSPSDSGKSATPASQPMQPTPTASPNQSNDSVLPQDLFNHSIDYNLDEPSFDFSFASNNDSMNLGDAADGSKSDSTENENNEKRSHPDDEDDEDGTENGAKRRESSDKHPKKPGRKPLTNEPSSKRKAQNRAAQRAFRERKEKHLKDLETKVEELEKASEAANHENTLLRAQVDRMTTELDQYKSKISGVSANSLPNAKDNDTVNFGPDPFQFDFPKFGPFQTRMATKTPARNSSQPISPPQGGSPVAAGNKALSDHTSSTSTNSQSGQHSRNAAFGEGIAKFNGLYNPSTNSSHTTASRTSVDSAGFSVSGATSSPSASSHSNSGAFGASSCGTSPEPLTQSPGCFKPMDNLGTIGEEPATISASSQPFAHFGASDVSNNNFDWLAQQNGGQFDPQLFSGYREPHDNVLSNPSFDDFFNDAFDNDFFMPYNTSPLVPEKSAGKLIDQIDAQKESPESFNPGAQGNVTCHQFWEKLEEFPNAKNGDFDLDGLCSELTKKAKCSGTGPMVPEQDFDGIVRKYLGKDTCSKQFANTFGIQVDKSKKNELTL